MKKIYINTGNTTTILSQLNKALGGKMTTVNDESKILLKSDLARGRIKSSYFKEGALYMQFDLYFTEEVSLSLESFENVPLFFAYCSYGEIKHGYGFQNNNTFCLKAGKSAIINGNGNVNTVVSFKKNQRISFSLLGMATQSSRFDANYGMKNQLKALFVDDNHSRIKSGKSNSRIKQNLQALNQINSKSTESHLAKKALVDQIFGYEIAQYTSVWETMLASVNLMVPRYVLSFKNYIHTLYTQITNGSLLVQGVRE
ncbi:hypothetical protein [Flavobacterium agrisoli]|uniref:Uncharacterized protein n=1 Tax=Flavobacterium agrisoli TaxID=2793066 RepID=A0A934PN51_9FLAO|nr:hypothetical protein [Flavobacterium agrisoli]MBK0370329.1 hypothetical protein [Flavobacterium agrisoli]